MKLHSYLANDINLKSIFGNIILIFDIKENERTYNRQLIYQHIYILNV